MSRSMMTLPSGVICGLTLSERFAFWNDVAVAPLLVADWYGICVPCSIIASVLSAVTTRGLEITLPLLSASSAESSRLRNCVAMLLNNTSDRAPGLAPPIPTAGRLTLLIWFRLVVCDVVDTNAEVLGEVSVLMP